MARTNSKLAFHLDLNLEPSPEPAFHLDLNLEPSPKPGEQLFERQSSRNSLTLDELRNTLNTHNHKDMGSFLNNHAQDQAQGITGATTSSSNNCIIPRVQQLNNAPMNHKGVVLSQQTIFNIPKHVLTKNVEEIWFEINNPDPSQMTLEEFLVRSMRTPPPPQYPLPQQRQPPSQHLPPQQPQQAPFRVSPYIGHHVVRPNYAVRPVMAMGGGVNYQGSGVQPLQAPVLSKLRKIK